MYLKISDKCNMTCAHCCFSCTASGDEMTLETFRAALKAAADNGDAVVLGGGEPTIHPLFWQFLGEAIASIEYVWLATNGKKTEIAVALAKLAKRGVIGCALSQDEWHEPIDEKVVEAFGNIRKPQGSPYHNEDHDGREIRNVGNGKGPIKAGRCDWGREDDCACSELHVKPNGDIHLCGCENSPKIGDVFNGYKVPQVGHDTGYAQSTDYAECVKQLKPKKRRREVRRLEKVA